jgi:predicted nucleotidyltransferase component of viral defense system
MMIKYDNFNQLVEIICQDEKHINLRPVIEKELLHYDILFALSENNLLNKIVFQGGTALRLCYKLQRFSEDLDFAGGVDFSKDDLLALKEVIENYIGHRYGLEVLVKEPKLFAYGEKNKVHVTKWQIVILTHPQRKDLPKQKIKFEVANVPAYTRKLVPLHNNYQVLPDGYTETFVYVESLDEILADKMIAYVARKEIKCRDVWDLQWLHNHNAIVNLDFIEKKIVDYKIENFRESLKERIQELKPLMTSGKFHKEMVRFLDSDTINKTFNKEGFLPYITENITELLLKVLVA